MKTNYELIKEWFAEYADFGETIPVRIEPIKSAHKFGQVYRCTFEDGRVDDYHASFNADGSVELEGIL